MIGNVVFDMGQVLTRFDPDSIIRCFVDSEEDIPLIRREVFEADEWVELDRGILTEESLTPIVCERLPERLCEPVTQLLLHWREHMTALDNMEPLVRDLKGAGYSLYLLSNAGLSMLRFTDRLPALRYFSGTLFSAEVHFLKPGREIYLAFFERFSLNPRECFFIDDQQANIDTARELGMDGFRYTGEPELLRAALKRAGIAL